MNDRQAFTLTELLITMSAGSTLMMLAVGLVHQSMHLTTAARGRADEHRAISKLANQFRQDVHWADEVVVESAETVRLSIRSVGEVTYDCQASECVRLAPGEPATGDQAARPHRERFLLKTGGAVLFEMLEQPSRAVLTVFRGEVSGKQAILNVSSGDTPARSRPPALRVEAVIGRLAQITEAQAEEESNVSQRDEE